MPLCPYAQMLPYLSPALARSSACSPGRRNRTASDSYQGNVDCVRDVLPDRIDTVPPLGLWGMRRFSLASVVLEAFNGHRGWPRQWRNPAPKPAYDIIIVGAGGHGLATAYY